MKTDEMRSIHNSHSFSYTLAISDESRLVRQMLQSRQQHTHKSLATFRNTVKQIQN